MQRLALVGFMASGKTTVSRHLAMLLNLPVIDLDAEIVRAAGKSIPEFFSDFGEDSFRKYECRILHEISQGERACVLATGGGTITQEAAREILQKNYYVVFLDVPIETAIGRIRQDGGTRPLARDTSDMVSRLENLLLTRRPFYEAVADYSYRIKHQDSQQIAAEILAHIEKDEAWLNM